MRILSPVGYEFANFKLNVERLELAHRHTLLRIEPKRLRSLLEDRERRICGPSETRPVAAAALV